MIDVSVLTPSFGYGRFIRDNLLSVQGQEGVSVQHIVQDAGSTDETSDVLRGFGDAVEWVSEPDEGQSDALNRAVAKAEGRWVGWLNADEFYLPGALKALVERGDETGADVVFGDNVLVDGDGRLLQLLPQHRFSLLVLRLYGCYIASSSLLIRRAALPQEPWDRSLRMMMDWELYLRLDSIGARFVDLTYPTGAFRKHAERVTAAPSSDFAQEYARVFDRYGISPRTRRWGKWMHGAYKLASGSYRRQSRTRSFRGHDLRWFADGRGSETFARLMSTTYGSPTSGKG